MTHTKGIYLLDVIDDLIDKGQIQQDRGLIETESFPRIEIDVNNDTSETQYYATIDGESLSFKNVPRKVAVLTSMSDALIKGYYVPLSREEAPKLDFKMKARKPWQPDMRTTQLRNEVSYIVNMKNISAFQSTGTRLDYLFLEGIRNGQLMPYEDMRFMDELSYDDVIDRLSIHEFVEDHDWGWGEEETEERMIMTVDKLFIGYSELFSSSGQFKGRSPKYLAMVLSSEISPMGIDVHVCYFKFEDVYSFLFDQKELFFVNEKKQVGHILNLLIESRIEKQLVLTQVATINKTPLKSFTKVNTNGTFVARTSTHVSTSNVSFQSLIPDFGNPDTFTNENFQPYFLNDRLELVDALVEEVYRQIVLVAPEVDNTSTYTQEDFGKLELIFDVTLTDGQIQNKKLVAIGFVFTEDSSPFGFEQSLFYLPRSYFETDQQLMPLVEDIEQNRIQIPNDLNNTYYSFRRNEAFYIIYSAKMASPAPSRLTSVLLRPKLCSGLVSTNMVVEM